MKTIFILGPTCIGKSLLALKLAKSLGGEIINADSMQVYSNLKIITARPNHKDTKLIKHHLYGYIDGSVRYNVSKWCKDTSDIINLEKDKTHNIVVGGTGLYVDKLLNGLVQVPSIPEEIKKESELLLKKEGLDKFKKRVNKIDPELLKKISFKDTLRLRRIWEVYRHTNKNLSFWLKNKNRKYLYNPKYLIYLFTPDRDEIYKRVNDRFVKMINNGAVEEVKKLNSLKFDKSLPIMKAHGVPEISKYLSSKCSLEESIEKAQQVTRNYVKRQLTWWRSSKLKIHQQIEHFPSEIDIKLLKF